MLQDIRFALRQLRRTPVFAVVTVLTFGLGMGANAAVFSVMNAVVLKLLPVAEADRLVFLHISRQPNNGSQAGFDDTSSLSYPVFEQLRAERRVFSDLMAYVPLGLNQVAVRYGTEAEAAVADMVTGNFFSGLRVTMERGRSFTMDDEEQHTQNAVISYGYWARRLGRRADAIGKCALRQRCPLHDRRHHRAGIRGAWPRTRDRCLVPDSAAAGAEALGTCA